MEPTLEPLVWIIARGIDADGTPWLRYRDTESGEEWVIRGVCNQCGLCVVGAADAQRFVWHGPPGTPYAVTDLKYGLRLDETVRPSMIIKMGQMAADLPDATVSGCSLTVGE